MMLGSFPIFNRFCTSKDNNLLKGEFVVSEILPKENGVCSPYLMAYDEENFHLVEKVDVKFIKSSALVAYAHEYESK